VDLRSQVAVLVAHWRLVAGGVVLAALAAFGVSSLLPKVYDSQATLLVGNLLTAANPDQNQLQASQSLSQTYVALVSTRPILEKAITSLELPYTADQLRTHVSVDQPKDTSLLVINVQDGDATRAAAIANAIASGLIGSSPTGEGGRAATGQFVVQELQATQDQIQAVQADLAGLSELTKRTTDQELQLQRDEDRLVTLRSSYATLLAASNAAASNLVTVVDPALPATNPSSPRILLNTLLGTIAGLVIAVALAFLLEYLDDAVRSPEEMQAISGLPALGSIARMQGDAGRDHVYSLVTLVFPRSPAAEAFKTLRTNLAFASVDTPLGVVLVTSASAGEGKTTVAANLAVAFAQAGRRTVLVDADLRKPDAHRLLHLPPDYGLTDLLRAPESNLDAYLQPTEQPNLRFLAAGALPPNPAELLASQRMHGLAERIRAAADVFILDSPPVLAVTDAAVLSSVVDGVIVVADAQRTSRVHFREGCAALAKVGAPTVGAVFNRLPASATHRPYYGGRNQARPDEPAPGERHVPAADAGH